MIHKCEYYDTTIKNEFGFSGKPMPSKCPDCNKTMLEVKYESISTGYTTKDTVFQRHCKCGCIIRWQFPNIFVRRHILPLFDMKQFRRIISKA